MHYIHRYYMRVLQGRACRDINIPAGYKYPGYIAVYLCTLEVDGLSYREGRAYQ